MPLDERIARLKKKLLTSPYEVCMARAYHFTQAYKETEGLDPAMRNALALKKTLENQKIFIYPDEFLAGSKTEKFLAGPLSVERGDFLRTLQMEMDILHLKQRPFLITEEEKKLFREVILPYWDGKTLRDHKAKEWEKKGLIDRKQGFFKRLFRMIKFIRYVGRENLRKIAGANRKAPLTFRRLKNLHALRYELACNNPSPAVFCFDVQGHLSLGVNKVIENGMEGIIKKAEDRLKRLEVEEPYNEKKKNFLKAVIISLESAIRYSERFAELAEEMAKETEDEKEKNRLLLIAKHCRHVPRYKPRTFHEALQSAWITHLVGEIQYGTHEVFAPGRIDQFLYPFYENDIRSGRITRDEAKALIQEFLIKLESNVEPIPEVGMETNAVLGNSQHVVTIGGLKRDGEDGTNELSYLILEAYEEMGGAVNQLAVRISKKTPFDFLKRACAVFRKANGIAFYNDEAIIEGLLADGMSIEDARDYCIVGCIETSGQSNTHGCVGGHELVLPVVLIQTLTRGKEPPPFIGQKEGIDCGDPSSFKTFEDFISAFKKQLAHQIKILVEATEGKDKAYREILPAPYVSALMDDCIEKAMDVTEGGARYDFTSIDVRGLATLVDSLLAIKRFVYEKKELALTEFIKIIRNNFKGHEVLRQRIINEAPKFGRGDGEADEMAKNVLHWIYEISQRYRNIRGGRFRVCYYSYGNHVIDGFMLGATPDGRLKGEPISNGVSPVNMGDFSCGPMGPMRSVAKFPPREISSGIALNMRFHPSFIKTQEGLITFAKMIKTYFEMGGMHIQPNVVSSETLRDAQKNPERYRDLIVKVSGYSAYFTDLGKSIQEDIISRYEFCRS
jgi:pyruvate formate-lyase/glycerol dehydratase family glycyl radical enzyme